MKNATTVIILITGCIAGIAVTLLFRPEPPPPAVIIHPEEIKNKVIAHERNYDRLVDSLKQGTLTINRQLNDTKNELAHAQKKNTLLRLRVNELLHSDAPVLIKDTLTMPADCDSLKTSVAVLLQNDNTKDSLYAEMDSLYQSRLSLKDAVIQTQEDKYNLTRSAFNQSLEQLQSQSAQLNRLTSQVKRQTRKNKLMAAGVVIAAGIVAGILLAHPK